MKRRKTLYCLLGVLVLVAVAAVVLNGVNEHIEKIKTTNEIIISVEPSAADNINCSYNTGEISFHKENGEWIWDKDEAFPVDSDKVNEMLSCFTALEASFVIEDPDNLADYGLKKPVCTIELASGESNYTIQLGDYSTMDSERYVDIGDGNVYLVKVDPLESFNKSIDDFMKHDETPSFDNIRSVTFSGSENYSIYYDEDNAAAVNSSDRYYTDDEGVTLPLDTYRVEDYCASISLLSLKNYVSYNVTEEELSSWGLDEPELTITVEYTDTEGNEKSFSMDIGRNRQELEEKQKAEDRGEEYSASVSAYVRVENSPIVYTLNETSYSNLAAADYNDLRHRELAAFDFDTVSGMEIRLDGEVYSFNIETNTDDEKQCLLNGEITDITDIQKKITALTIEEFNDYIPDGKQEIALSFTFDNEAKSQQITELYRYDGTYCLAVLNGQTLGLVKRSAAMALVEAVYAVVLG